MITSSIEILYSLKSNLAILQNELKDCGDIIFQDYTTSEGVSACLIFVNGLIDDDLVQRDVLPVLLSLNTEKLNKFEEKSLFPATHMVRKYTVEETVDYILKAYTVILIDGINLALCINMQKEASREFEEPDVERITKGQHDGFVESISKNISLIRRKMVSAKLKVKFTTLGKVSKNHIAVLYIEDIASPEIVSRVQDRIKNIEIDYINDAGVIEQLISDNPYSLFPLYQGTERADKTIANLMEGRIVIMLDNTPQAIIVPVSYFQFFQTSEDYNSSFIFSTFLRLIRFGASVICILLPALYIALLTYHYQAIPLDLLAPLEQSRARVPFPPIIEALIMEIGFEVLREASVRLPQGLGPTIGIVGGLALGQTAVQAGLVSNVMVVVVGMTAIATFVIPQKDMEFAFRIGRFLSMINAAIFGAVGIMIFSLSMIAHLVTLESFEQPFYQPIAPFKPKGMKDTFFRVPLQKKQSGPGAALPRDKTIGRDNTGDETSK